ncbi:IclR family transcriptional regulator [Actinomadura scrupuli]|uniref:IclR family transcriptional regulator n=1 Tax=Actinomadura scrupuli TaxID=559629 RepID=UPI003D960096
MASEQGSNQSVERALGVLRSLAGDPTELRVSDVAKVTGLGVSTTSRLLATLESAGLVDRDLVTGLYRLGLDVVSLSTTVLNNHPIHREARQVCQNLAAELGLGVNAAIRRGDRLFYLLNFEGRHAPRSSVLAGQVKPLHATGLGKCLLSGLGPEQRRELLPAAGLVAYTARTFTTHEQLDVAIADIARHGHAAEIEELALSRACVAAPIRGATGQVVAALSVSGPLSAIDLPARQPELARRVIEAADSISIGLGFTGPAHLPAQLDSTR